MATPQGETMQHRAGSRPWHEERLKRHHSLSKGGRRLSLGWIGSLRTPRGRISKIFAGAAFLTISKLGHAN
ncbi:MAG: hypothetical protein DWI58_00865 [Chloroflexi bacterium]|nr:MAG: hypothetical protein DWI58_00865 [Chloroflexota bacterium]